MISYSIVCKLLRDTGCVELPVNLFSDDDITDLKMFFNEGFNDSKLNLEVVAFSDCYYLYLDTRDGAERFMEMIQVKLAIMECKFESYKRALYNVEKCIDYFQ